MKEMQTEKGLILTRRGALGGLGLVATGIGWHALGFSPAFAATEPAQGGVLRCRMAGDPPNFDMFTNSSGWVLSVVAACYNGLVRYDPKDPLKVVGDLAERWEMAEDGLSYTFHLVKTAKFHDGVPLTAADVKCTYDFAQNPPEGSSSIRKVLLKPIKEVVVVDDHTVRFDLLRRSPSLISTLATGWFVIAPKHILEAKGHMKDDVVGTGPFMLKSYSRGTSIELVRNSNYHVPNRPYLDGITFYIIPDTGTAFSYLTTGQIDMFHEVPGTDARRAIKDYTDVVKIHREASYVGDPYTVNMQREPFNDLRVRKALALSINHDEALRVVNQGDGIVAGLLPPTPWGLAAEDLAKMTGYNPDIEASRAEAKALLAEAGYKNGFDTSILVRRGAGTHEPRAIFLADQFSKIGVKMKINVQETASYFDAMNRRDFEVATCTVTSLANDPDFMFGDFHTSMGNLNYAGLSSQVIDNLFDKQSMETNPEKRKALVNELERATMNEFATVILYFKDKFVGVSARVQDFVMHPEPDNNRRMEEIWLQS